MCGCVCECRHFGPRLTGDIVEAIGSRQIAELVAVSELLE